MLSSKLQRAKVAFNTCLIPRSGRRGASVTAHDDYTDVRCTCHWHGSHDQCERMTAKFDARSVDLNSGTSLAPVVAVQCKTRIAIFYNGGNGVGDGRREDGQAKVEVPPSSPPLLAATVGCDPVFSARFSALARTPRRFKSCTLPQALTRAGKASAGHAGYVFLPHFF